VGYPKNLRLKLIQIHYSSNFCEVSGSTLIFANIVRE
jgi:hypothetical protein